MLALATLAAHAAKAQGVDDRSWRERLLAQADEVSASVRSFVDKHIAEKSPMTRMRGLYVIDEARPQDPPAWKPLAQDEPLVERAIVLVHGLDDPGDLWDDLAPALRDDESLRGRALLRFEYPNDQAICTSADMLGAALRDISSRGVKNVDLVCHSMGGLVARDVLTRAEFYASLASATGLPKVDRFIMMGTPNSGSPLATLRGLTETREILLRWFDSDEKNVHDLVRTSEDGKGEAADDLLPGSNFLKDLSSRALPLNSSVKTTNIIGRLAAEENPHIEKLLASEPVAKVLSSNKRGRLVNSLRDLNRTMGDGVVTVDSAQLPGVTDTVYVAADHRGMVKRTLVSRVTSGKTEPPAISVVLDRLRTSGE